MDQKQTSNFICRLRSIFVLVLRYQWVIRQTRKTLGTVGVTWTADRISRDAAGSCLPFLSPLPVSPPWGKSMLPEYGINLHNRLHRCRWTANYQVTDNKTHLKAGGGEEGEEEQGGGGGGGAGRLPWQNSVGFTETQNLDGDETKEKLEKGNEGSSRENEREELAASERRGGNLDEMRSGQRDSVPASGQLWLLDRQADAWLWTFQIRLPPL